MKKNLFKISLVLVFVFFGFLLVSKAKAASPETVRVNLRVETATQTLFNGAIDVAPCSVTPEQTATTTNGLCALEQSGLALAADWRWLPSAFITSIGGVSQNAASSTYWLWFSDLNVGQTAINQHELTAGEQLLFVLGINPLKISASNSSPVDGATTTISAWQFDQTAFDWLPAANATVDFGWGATTTDINGQADITATSSLPFSVSAGKLNFLASNIVNITPQAAQANIIIRDGETVAFSGAVTLPALNAAAVDISPTGATSTVAVTARSLLSVLQTLDAAQNEFTITNLQYYSSFNSFFINCITMAAEADPLCGSWQYILNGADPGVGTDQVLLKNGDLVFLYFGTPRRVALSTTAATAGVPFTATAQSYDPANNVYAPITGVTIGVTQPNPADPWNPLEVATSTADANGQTVFTLNSTGAYGVGIKDDFYFPLTALTVASSSPADNQTSNNQSSGGSVIIPSAGGGSPAGAVKVNLNQAIDFLISKQEADGSFDSGLQTDWAAIALAAANPNGARQNDFVGLAAAQKIRAYLLTDPDPLIGLNQVSDYARRAMALMSLNISPYNGVKTNYVKKIADLFDGRQFGQTNLYNDDIFALVVLNKVGYEANEEIIKKTVAFIISNQFADGSWNGVDLTAAAIQALAPLSSSDEAASALAKAKSFLAGAQKADGGFGDTYGTAWTMQAISAFGENAANWQKNNNTPESFLSLSQGADGGLEKNSPLEINRLWSTSYAIPAVLGKPWFNILNSFSKPEIMIDKKTRSGGSENPVNNLIATSTSENLATSSPQALNQEADIPETSLLAQANNKNKEDKPVKPAAKPTAKAAAAPVKSLAPQVLGEKIVRPEPLPAAADNIGKKPDSKSQTITEAAENKANLLAPEINGAAEKPVVQKKINSQAKKVFYLAGAGAILAGVLLLLKLLGFLL